MQHKKIFCGPSNLKPPKSPPKKGDGRQIIFVSGFQCSILCLECAAFKAVAYALGCNQSRGLSGKNLNFRIQYRSSLKNIYSVFLFSEFHVSVISHGSVNLYSVAYLTNMIYLCFCLLEIYCF
jgi:hypothetical protein